MSKPPTRMYRTPDGPRRRWSVRLWIGLALGMGALGVLFILTSLASTGSRDTPPRARCVSNEHLIGLGILLYQQDHGGHYPDSLAAVLSAEEIGSQVFCCPSTTDTLAQTTSLGNGTPPTTQQAAAAFAAGGHVSYAYFGHADWTDPTVPADAIVIAEPPSNHGGTGSNILFGDGHAEWIPIPRAARLIATAAATTRPVSAATVP